MNYPPIKIPAGAGGGGSGDLKADGTVPLTADWDAGSHKITAEQIASDIANGTAPLIVTSSTLVTNLNADQVDGTDLADILANSEPDPKF